MRGCTWMFVLVILQMSNTKQISPVVIIYPYPDSCFLSSDRLLLSISLAPHVYWNYPADKICEIYINGAKAARSTVSHEEATRNNIQVDLQHFTFGSYDIQTEIFNIDETWLGSASVSFTVDPERCGELVPSPPIEAHPERDAIVTECNLALQRPTMQSSTEAGYESDAAVDGLTSTAYDALVPLAARTQEEERPWWVVDLEGDRVVQSVWVAGEMLLGAPTDYPQVFPRAYHTPLRVTLYAAAGHVVYEAEVAEGAVETLVPAIQVAARYVRVQAEGTAVLGLREVRVLGEGCWECEAHCVNGQCVAGRCVCDGDWVGPDCATHLLTDTVFLPPAASLSAWQETAPDSTWFDAPLWEEALRAIRRHLHPPSCTTEDALVFEFPNAGFASTLHFLAGIMSMGMAHGRTATPSTITPWVYALHSADCDAKSFSCYFEAWSNCSDQRMGAASAYFIPETIVEHFHFVPPRFAHKGVFWWRAAQMWYLLRFRAETEALLDLPALRRAANFSHPIIGLHVRRGDSCHTTLRRNRCIPITRHAEEVRRMTAKYGVYKVFLATDDAAAQAELQALLPNHTFTSISTYDRETLQSGDRVWLENRIAAGEVSGHELLTFTVRDLLLLAEADFFIGHFSSNLSRLAFLRAAANRRYPPPFASVDGPWCYHWRMCCTISARFPHSSVC